MWPEPVERIAAVLRTAGVPAQLEELPAGTDSAPGAEVRADGFDCDGRALVAVVPGDRVIDRDKLAAAAGCARLRPATLPEFPFQPARVLIERALLSLDTVWLEAGSPRHALGLAPAQLAGLTSAETADLLAEG